MVHSFEQFSQFLNQVKIRFKPLRFARQQYHFIRQQALQGELKELRVLSTLAIFLAYSLVVLVVYTTLLMADKSTGFHFVFMNQLAKEALLLSIVEIFTKVKQLLSLFLYAKKAISSIAYQSVAMST